MMWLDSIMCVVIQGPQAVLHDNVCCLCCRLLTEEEQELCGVKIGEDYPEPIPASSFGRPHGGNFIGGDPAAAATPVVMPSEAKRKHTKHRRGGRETPHGLIAGEFVGPAGPQPARLPELRSSTIHSFIRYHCMWHLYNV